MTTQTKPNVYTIKYGGMTTNINLPPQPIRKWNNNYKIRFYHRGGKYRRDYPPLFYELEGRKPPRRETQIYVDGKYFLQLKSDINKEGEEVVRNAFKILYCFGCDLEEIKRILQKCFYKSKRGN